MALKKIYKRKNIRFPNDVLRQAEEICVQRGYSFSTFVEQAVENALADLRNEREPS